LKAISLHIIILLAVTPAFSQTLPDLRFSHVTERDGLSNNFVRAIVQDGDGLIWIATENGLNRFDGYGFKSFYADTRDSQSLQNNRIEQLVADNKGHLWGSTSDGVFCFSIAEQRTSAWPPNPADNKNITGSIRPFHVFLDDNQLPWNSNYSGIAQDNAGGLWATRFNSIYRIDPRTRDILQTLEGPPKVVIRDIRFDSYHRCWISTWGKGIYLVDLGKNTWTPFSPSDIRTVVYGGTEWSLESQPWMVFACSFPCIFLVNEKDLSTRTILFDSTTMSFSGPPFVDRQNILWLPTSDGVYYSSSSNNLYKVIDIPVLPSKVPKPAFAHVYCIREDSTGYWLSKRYYGGIFHYDKHWRLLRTWAGAEVLPSGRFGSAGAPSGEAFDFQRIGDELFITTESGISILDLRTNHWTIIPPPEPNPFPRLRNIIIRGPRVWWIRSYNHGVYVFDPISRQFTHCYTNPDTSSASQPWVIHGMTQDKYRHVFAATNAGLFRYDPATDAFRQVRINGKFNPGRTLFGLAADSSGLLLVGGENGLFVYNPLTGAIQRTFKEDNKIGLVTRICIDDHQNAWFGSVSGYWCWLRKTDKVFHFEYGLGLPTTDDGAMYSASDGAIYAGGKDAITRFYPDRLMTYHSTALTKIIAALVGDSVKPFTTNTDGHRQLTLQPDRNSFSVDFDVVNYDLISSNQYYYKLTPGNPNWRQSENGHLTFYNLQPGSYTLEVKGASKLTGSFTNTDTLDITVKPYWYQSTWFRIGSLLLLCMLAWYLVRYRIRAVRKDAAFRQKMSEMEMTALRAQMNPHFIFNSLNSIENFIMQNEKRLASDYLNKFASLVRMILENSRNQAVPLIQDMEAVQLYVDLEKLRFEDKFCYITEIDEVLLKGDYRVAPLLIQPFVENAIVHGLAPSEKPGLYLKIIVRLRDDFIHYTIEDNGIGRTESMAYSRKYRPGHKSLGLEISRERIDLINRKHGTAGTLDIIDLYDDRQPAGTRVVLTININ
jgi:ligand-binding sensor domain-containing protein